MASHPPRAYCYQGVLHQGTPTGTIDNVGSINVYIKYPEDNSTEHGILILSDVLGHTLNNTQLIADQFGANGYFVMVPDLFEGDPCTMSPPAGFDIGKWFQGAYNKDNKPHMPPQVDPIVESCLDEMRNKYNVKKIGAVGYCFGGKYVVRHLKPGKIDVGYTAHPTYVDKEEILEMRGPLAISAAETDVVFPAEKRHETEELLKQVGFPYQLNLYSGVSHGFAVRGDLEKRQIQFAKESAFLQAVQFFEEYLKR